MSRVREKVGGWTALFTHTLYWDGMGWAALVTRCISMEAFTH